MIVGLFGKLPASGDFFRSDAAGPAAQALITWLHEAIEPVHRASLPLPAQPVRFLVHASDTDQAVVGAMTASQDRVGRHFPLCAFVTHTSASLGRDFPAMTAATDRFCAAAEERLAQASGMEPAALAAAARTLPPLDDVREVAPGLASKAAARPLPEFLSSTYRGLPEGAPAYGLSTLVAAIRTVRTQHQLRTSIALDVIARDDVERYVWLELIRLTLRWSVPPSLFWTRDHLLVSLGPPPATLLQHLCDPSQPPARIWPLRSDRTEAIAAARRGLAPEVLRVLAATDAPAAALFPLATTLGGGRA